MANEIRGGIPAEIRSVGADTVRVAGYAAVFNEETNIGDYFIEKIAPGAFTKAVSRDDVVFLINHQDLPLARTRSGTLKLTEDTKGLYIETDLDRRDPDVQNIIFKMERGDLDKMSFAFRATKQSWDETGKIPVRTIEEVELFDVSIVTSPAYEGTDISLCSLRDHRAAVAARNFNAARMRRRMKADLAARLSRENG
jgi:HK97 family phage prohead protease